MLHIVYKYIINADAQRAHQFNAHGTLGYHNTSTLIALSLLNIDIDKFIVRNLHISILGREYYILYRCMSRGSESMNLVWMKN